MKWAINSITVFGFLVLGIIYVLKFLTIGNFGMVRNISNYTCLGLVCFLICNRISHPYIAINLIRYKVSIHESIHIIIALLFGKQMTESKTSHTNGGYIKYQGGLKFPGVDMLISLAPYFLSYLVLVCIVLKTFTIY